VKSIFIILLQCFKSHTQPSTSQSTTETLTAVCTAANSRWLDEDPAPSPKRGRSPKKFLAHVYYGQMAEWIKMALGMEVGLSPGDFVLDGDPAPLSKKGAEPPPQFSANLYCGQTAGCIMIPLLSTLCALLLTATMHTLQCTQLMWLQLTHMQVNAHWNMTLLITVIIVFTEASNNTQASSSFHDQHTQYPLTELHSILSMIPEHTIKNVLADFTQTKDRYLFNSLFSRTTWVSQHQKR